MNLAVITLEPSELVRMAEKIVLHSLKPRYSQPGRDLVTARQDGLTITVIDGERLQVRFMGEKMLDTEMLDDYQPGGWVWRLLVWYADETSRRPLPLYFHKYGEGTPDLKIGGFTVNTHATG